MLQLSLRRCYYPTGLLGINPDFFGVLPGTGNNVWYYQEQNICRAMKKAQYDIQTVKKQIALRMRTV